MNDFLGRNDAQVRCTGVLHIVKDGDTLYKIARQYGVPLSRVMYANPYVNVYNLQAGDEICVPVMTPRQVAEEAGDCEMHESEGFSKETEQPMPENCSRCTDTSEKAAENKAAMPWDNVKVTEPMVENYLAAPHAHL